MAHSKRLYLISFVVVVLIFCSCVGLNLQAQEIIFRDEDFSEDPACNSSNGRSEKCVDIHSCPLLLGMVANPDKHELLQQINCGWNQSIPKVCCDMNWNCTTPDNEPGHCIKFTSCRHITAKVIHVNISQEIITSIRNLRCGSNRFDVCCTTLSSNLNIPLSSKYNEKNEIQSTTTEMMRDSITVNSMTTENSMVTLPPDPLSGICGQELSANRIIGGEETAIDQYPWTAALEYLRENVIEIKCGGTLITGTFVVTAAHCVFGSPPPINVRLGDYDIDHPGEDCVVVEGGGEDCTEEPMTIPIVNIIPYPDYVPEQRTHDIALIKLQNTAPYTDFIRPICLPTTDYTETATITVKLTVAGWGASDLIRKYSSIKRHVEVPFVGRENCSYIYSRKNVTLGVGQICAGGARGKDSCKGDSGGALMEIKEKMTEIVGIVSFGFIPCGLENSPAVYTKVYHYLPWIRSIINRN